MNRASRALLMSLIGLTLCLGGCGSDYLRDDNFYTQDTDFTIDREALIADTDTHRAILDVLAQYRTALVRKDFGSLNRIIAEDYYDNGSTTDTTRDDYGYKEMAEIFELLAQRAETIRYRIIVKQLSVENLTAHVDYEYKYAYQYRTGNELTWDAGVEVNRVELQQRDGAWKIVSGL